MRGLQVRVGSHACGSLSVLVCSAALAIADARPAAPDQARPVVAIGRLDRAEGAGSSQGSRPVHSSVPHGEPGTAPTQVGPSLHRHELDMISGSISVLTLESKARMQCASSCGCCSNSNEPSWQSICHGPLRVGLWHHGLATACEVCRVIDKFAARPSKSHAHSAAGPLWAGHHGAGHAGAPLLAGLGAAGGNASGAPQPDLLLAAQCGLCSERCQQPQR